MTCGINTQVAQLSGVSSHTATTGFGALAVGTSKQNTLGYNILVNVSIAITAAAAATVTLGVGSATGPTADPVIASLSVATVISFSAIVPVGYWIVVNTTGTITVGTITTQVCPI